MIQLSPPLPFSTPKGEGFAHFLADYGPESDLYWVVFMTATGEIWTFANKEVRASKNITLGRTDPTAPKPAPPSPIRQPENMQEIRVVNAALVETCGQDQAEDR